MCVSKAVDATSVEPPLVNLTQAPAVAAPPTRRAYLSNSQDVIAERQKFDKAIRPWCQPSSQARARLLHLERVLFDVVEPAHRRKPVLAPLFHPTIVLALTYPIVQEIDEVVVALTDGKCTRHARHR